MNTKLAWIPLTCLVLLVPWVGLAQWEVPTVRKALPVSDLVDPAEIERLEAQLWEKVRENQLRKCERPVLRGKAAPGSADEAIIAVLEGEAFTECFDAVKEASKEIREWLTSDAPSAEPPGGVLTLCAKLPQAVTSAVAHTDACSPYLFGRRGMPKMIKAVQAGKALAVLVRVMAREGKVDEAVALGLDSVRFFQDLARGEGASLLTSMIGVVSAREVVMEGLRPALQGGAPTAAVLKRSIAETKALLASEIDFCDSLAYEHYGMALQMLLPALKPCGWTPPGGYDEGHKPKKVDRPAPTPGSLQWNESAVAWLGMERVHVLLAKACRSGQTIMEKKRAMEAAGEALLKRSQKPVWRRYLAIIAAKDPKAELRDWIIDILSGIAIPSMGGYATKYYERRFSLEAIQLHMQFIAARSNKGTCPSIDALRSLADASAPKGELPLQVSMSQDGAISILPPKAYCDELDEEDSPPSYTFTCK